MHQLVAALVLATALLLGACGQMGPLYEPEATPPTPVPVTPPPVKTS